MILDLGCGDQKQGDVGIDLYMGPGVDYKRHLGFDPLPCEDNAFDKVRAYDLLEHIPKMVHITKQVAYPACYDNFLHSSAEIIITHPHIRLFSEVWRVLKPDGIFETFTPTRGPHLHGRVFHVSEWNLDTFKQFTKEGSDYRRGFMQQAGFRGCFSIAHHEEIEGDGGVYLRVDLKKEEV